MRKNSTRKNNAQAPQTPAGRRTLVAQLADRVRDFLTTETGSVGLLLAAVVVALVWANSPWSDAYTSLWATEASFSLGSATLSMDLGHWVSDGLMALFFFVIGLEVRYEISVGVLTDRRRAVIPALAGIGGMLVPA
ncbi:Na+/H+ antiporter NhaA, partial [Streptomyces sp. NPDC050388]|uniref:Na+/H+ antiporter NhaA n=1 Tax=Streptomyces sp. NPDC050388 TaxID=3155781 RepID=UPI003431F4D3